MKFSVIIPTYNRCLTLARTLSSIESQTFSKNEFDVIIVDDGSADGTKMTVENFSKTSSLNIKYFYRQHEGPAQARNFGIDKSHGDILLFCGDDTIFDRRLMENHYKTHQNEGTANIAVLGTVVWDESIKINDFMRYIAPNGPQFHFNAIKNDKDAGWRHFYTCNISLARKNVGQLRFDSRYIYAAFEDIDFGFLLAKTGLKVIFNKEAIVYHSHFYVPESFYDRMVSVGKSFVILGDKFKKSKIDYLRLKLRYAPFDLLPGQLRLFNFLTKLLAGSKILKKLAVKYHWYFSICYYYSLGIMQAK